MEGSNRLIPIRSAHLCCCTRHPAMQLMHEQSSALDVRATSDGRQHFIPCLEVLAIFISLCMRLQQLLRPVTRMADDFAAGQCIDIYY